MTLVRLASAIMLALLFLVVAAFNGYVFVAATLLRKRAPSWIPLVAGISGVVAIIISPLGALRSWWWMPLVGDWGSLPGIGYAVLNYAWHRLTGRIS
jgi:hypothetical protein